MRYHIAFASTGLLLFILLGCGNNSGNPVSVPEQTSHKKIVQMMDNVFSPQDVVISVGDTVEWVNVGNNGHSSTSGTGCTGDGLWDSGILAKGGKFTVIFDTDHVNQTGAIPYFCIPHCAFNMRGTITVNP